MNGCSRSWHSGSSRLSTVKEPFYSGAAVAEALRHAKEHADLYHAVLSGAAGAEARAGFTAGLEEIVTELFTEMNKAARHTSAPVPVSFASATFSGAMFGHG